MPALFTEAFLTLELGCFLNFWGFLTLSYGVFPNLTAGNKS